MWGAAEWGDTRPVPVLNQPLEFQQRLCAAGLASALLVQMSGSTALISRVLLVCGGVTLGHATFRARSLAARWSRFKSDAKAQ